MYKLKQIAEDFIVKEISNVKIKDSGVFTYVLVRKKSRNTMDVVKEMSRQLNISEKKIGFAGIKDKHAVTEQVFSFERISKEKLLKLNINNVEIEILGFGLIPISLGDLSGNNFEIVVRNLDSVKVENISFVANYFDEQRFSSHNVEIGRHLIRKEFSQAAKLIDTYKVKEHLEKHENDFVGAIKKVSKRLLNIYSHAYQSYLWNEVLAEYLESKKWKEVSYSQGKFIFVKEREELSAPLIGFGTELTEKFKGIIEKVMEKEDLMFSDFIIKQFPEVSLEGGFREAFVSIQDLIISKIEDDELNIGKKKVKIYFALGRGSYATMVIKKLFG